MWRRAGWPKKTGIATAGGPTVLLAILAMYNPCTEARFATDHPPPGRFVTVDGVKLDVLERGTGSPTVALIHGNPGLTLDVWEPLAEKLASKYHVMAIDRPGSGWSERPDLVITPAEQTLMINGVVQSLGLDKPIVAGFSYGGPITLAWAIDHPESMRALVLTTALASPTAGHLENPMWPLSL